MQQLSRQSCFINKVKLKITVAYPCLGNNVLIQYEQLFQLCPPPVEDISLLVPLPKNSSPPSSPRVLLMWILPKEPL